jgi:hypothetical protein
MAAIIDDFPSSATVDSPAEDWAALTPSETVAFTFLPKAIAVGATAGSFIAVGRDGVTATFYAVAGQVIRIRPTRINSTGLTGGMTFVGLR